MHKIKQTKYWYLYDFANSAYALVVMSLFFPLYFATFLYPEGGESVWGVVVAISILCTALVAPLLGAKADLLGKRLTLFKYTSIFAALGCISLALLGYVSSNAAVAIFVVVNTLFGLSLSLYDALLLDVTDNRKYITTYSGIGWALGYIGGPLCLLIIWLILGGELPTNKDQYEKAFLITGLFFLVISIYIFFNLKFDESNETTTHSSLSEVWTTLKSWRDHKAIWIFLAGMYFLMDGLTTIVYYTAIYAKQTLKFDTSDIVIFFLVVQFIGVPATYYLSKRASKWGELNVIKLCAVIWCLIILLLYWADGEQRTWFYVISVLTGLVVGTTPAVSRAYLAKIIPLHKRAQFFGFNTFASRFATIFGPLIFAVVSSLYGMKAALLSILPFFVLGVVLLSTLEQASRSDY